MLEVSGLFKRENHFLRIYCFYFRSFQPSPQNPRWHTGNTIWKNLTSGKTPKDILLRGIPEEIPEKTRKELREESSDDSREEDLLKSLK